MRVQEQRRAPLADRTELRNRELREVEGQRDRLAVEVAARNDQPTTGGQRRRVCHAAAREDERVVRRGIQLDVEDAAQVIEGIANRTMNLGHAAQ